MKSFFSLIVFLILVFSSSLLISQTKHPIIINHLSVDLSQILENDFINKAANELIIGYGHTSHGSQLITGMNALMAYYPNGKLKWSKNGGIGILKIEEGGTLELDCGYVGWDDKTRTYLNNNPKCNVIIWSWCGQVNDVDLNSHYLSKMEKLEQEYPNVKFVYMTGHLEGSGPDGSLEKANNTIRKFCNENNKILFDFGDIEKYSPNGDINYDLFNADDGCNYVKNGTKGNWANEWMQANPDNVLTKVSAKSSGCAHSISLNCVMKGIAAWQLWARLAGWEGTSTNIESKNILNNINVFPNPASEFIEIDLSNPMLKDRIDGSGIRIYDVFGQIQTTLSLGDTSPSLVGEKARIDVSELESGVYFVRIGDVVRKFVKI